MSVPPSVESGLPSMRSSSRMEWRLLVLILILQFFPIPKIPALRFAPENFAFLLALFLCWSMLFRLGLRGGRASLIVISLVAFGVLDWMHGFLQDDAVDNPARHVRAAVCILLVATVASHEVYRLRLMKWLVVVGCIQVVFGSLIYVFGEPFSTVRDWMLQSATEESGPIIGERSQIAGLYGPPHIFAYLLASFPLLGLGLYLLERRFIWLVSIVILLFGLFLNAERAAAGFMFCGMFILLWKSGHGTKALWLLGTLACIFLTLQHFLSANEAAPDPSLPGSTSFNVGTLAERFDASIVDEAKERLSYQVHGLVSVIKHPLLGPTVEQYASEVTGRDGLLVSPAAVAKVLSPHNHYVNIGVRGGVPGWLLMGVVAVSVFGIYRAASGATRGSRRLRVQFMCISFGLAAAMGNAVFHNAGVFSPELATSVMLGLLIGLNLDLSHQRRRRSSVGIKENSHAPIFGQQRVRSGSIMPAVPAIDAARANHRLRGDAQTDTLVIYRKCIRTQSGGAR